MQVLVTGAAGFIGSHLCERLLSDGHSVVGIDNFDPFYDVSIKRDNLKQALTCADFTFVEADIRDDVRLREILSDHSCEMIVHLAARAGVRPSIEDPPGYEDVNIRGTTVLLTVARDVGIRKFVFASSSSVYGNNEKVPFCETDNVDFPISPYAATKKSGELICHTYSHLYEMDISCLRFFTVYGPRQRPDLAIHKFARLITAGEPIPVFGDGSMMRDFTYIDDTVDGICAAMQHCRGYEIYNLGESQPVRLDALVRTLEEVLGCRAIIKRYPEQPGDVQRTYADISKARRRLGYDPKVSLRDGLKRFSEWFHRLGV